jgi:hypothetical protein
MKNLHIELVKKWLDDPKSVSAEELKRAAAAAYAADAADAAAAKYWIERYEELTK